MTAPAASGIVIPLDPVSRAPERPIMQFKGSIRAPGERGVGVQVVLVVDDYHLEVRRHDDLLGRWYLADVEVVRDIAERFTLYLGNDEMEFLADDALVFAYDGVTRMQEGWLNAQKKRRRRRRAAEQAAKLKDDGTTTGSVMVEEKPEPIERARPVEKSRKRKPAESELSRRLASLSEPKVTRDLLESEPMWEAPPEPVLSKARRPKSARTTQSEIGHTEPNHVESATELFDSGSPEAIESGSSSVGSMPRSLLPSNGKRPVGRAKTVGRESGSRHRSRLDEIEPVREEEQLEEPPVKQPARRKPQRREDPKAIAAPSPTSQVLPEEADPPPVTEIRFAADGHHPSETSTGLLSKLRRQPKPPDGHVHKYRDSGSAVGLSRRVCTECSHVSIGSEA
ncbi:MAG: hypothetical protein ACT4OP_04035 [Actinomycetota bacterium]